MKQLHIRKRTLPEWSALLLILMPFTYGLLTELIGLPNVIKFISDLLIIASMTVIALKSFYNSQLVVPRKHSAISLVILIFFLYTLIGYIFNYHSALYYIWGLRNNFRFYIAFLLYAMFLKSGEAKKCLAIIDILFWIHFGVTLIQYFAFGYQQDYLGGIFGIEKGCNGYVIVFISIVVIKSLLSYMDGNEKFIMCLLKCSSALLISVLAELKIFFLIFIFSLIVSAVITRFSVKKVAFMFVSFVVIVVAYMILIAIFENFKGFLSFEYLKNELFRENYASSEDIGRFTSIPTICKRFLTTFWDRLIGMGLGNCDTSTISVFNTDFYNQYVDIHYSVFSISFIFLETGFIGLFLFVLFFVICLKYSITALKEKKGNLLFNQMGLIMAILCFVLMFYNSSLRTEAGYMVYFALALPFIGTAENEEDISDNSNVYVPDNG